MGEFGLILHTTDGGTVWTIYVNNGTFDWPRPVSITDALTGTAEGDMGQILRTTDGGST